MISTAVNQLASKFNVKHTPRLELFAAARSIRRISIDFYTILPASKTKTADTYVARKGQPSHLLAQLRFK